MDSSQEQNTCNIVKCLKTCRRKAGFESGGDRVITRKGKAIYCTPVSRPL